MATKTVQDASLTAVADAIRAKTGKSASMEFPDEFVSEIGSISGGGGGSVSANAVNFRDYDGTIVASYSVSDFLALSAMPDNPSHDGLIAQGWNWSLSDAKAYVTKYGKLEVGQMYITDDGKTRVYIHLEEDRKSPMLGLGVDGTVDVDWGDGSAHDTLTGTSVSTVKWTPTHNYAQGGDYVIKMTVTGSAQIIGSSTYNEDSCLLRYSSGADIRNFVYRNTIERVVIGANVNIGAYAFDYCYSLASVTIPDGVTSIENYAFRSCCSLTSVTIPDSVTSIGSYAFGGCYGLASITIPDSVTSIESGAFSSCCVLASITIPDSVISIENYAFGGCSSLTSITMPDSVTNIGSSAVQYCYGLASITIPDNVTSIGSYAFYYCSGLGAVRCLSTTPPTLGNGSFTDIPSDCIIYVPQGSLEAYQTATNWSSYASRMQEETT